MLELNLCFLYGVAIVPGSNKYAYIKLKRPSQCGILYNLLFLNNYICKNISNVLVDFNTLLRRHHDPGLRGGPTKEE